MQPENRELKHPVCLGVLLTNPFLIYFHIFHLIIPPRQMELDVGLDGNPEVQELCFQADFSDEQKWAGFRSVAVFSLQFCYKFPSFVWMNQFR